MAVYIKWFGQPITVPLGEQEAELIQQWAGKCGADPVVEILRPESFEWPKIEKVAIDEIWGR